MTFTRSCGVRRSTTAAAARRASIIGCPLMLPERSITTVRSFAAGACRATGAAMARPFYAPADPLCRAREPDDRRWTVDHFYRKLLRIPDGLHTGAARAMASERTRFMEQFLEELERELAAG